VAPEIISRKQAREQGLKRYFNGIPCKAGHLTDRITLSGVCCQCYRDHFAKRRKQHRSEVELPPGLVIGLKQARAAGLRHYFTGVPCKRGHIDKRHTSNGSCLKCDQEKQRVAQWHKHNQEQHNANSRRWAEKNRTKFRETKRLSNNRRRAQKHQSGGTHTAADLAEILKAQGNRCSYCRTSFDLVKKQVDHIVPLSLGGTNGRANLQYLCRSCNQSKNARDPITYARLIGLLL
jgi:5-methylcytosine-specific restriction endonuclease McrA